MLLKVLHLFIVPATLSLTTILQARLDVLAPFPDEKTEFQEHPATFPRIADVRAGVHTQIPKVES